MYEEAAKCPPPNRPKPPKRDPPLSFSTLHIKSDPEQEGKEPLKESNSPACLCCNQAHPLYRYIMNLKESLYLNATRWSRVLRFVSIVSNREIKLMNAQTRLAVKLLTVRDIITVCYTMNVHLSNRLTRTHKLSPHGLQTAPSRTWQPPTPSLPMTECLFPSCPSQNTR